MGKKKIPFVFGTCTTPDGKRGDWQIDTFTLTKSDVLMNNLRALRDGRPELVCGPGTYKRLTHKTRGVVMSNTPMEVKTNRDAFDQATGRVLVSGLGMGMLLEGLLSKPDVTLVKVIEIDPDVIALVAPHFLHDKRFVIVQGDAYAYKPSPGEKYDYVYHDIWDDISADNLPLMNKLTRRWQNRTPAQGVWSRSMARRERERNRAYGW